MTNYTKLVESLRACSGVVPNCGECPSRKPNYYDCLDDILKDGADAIEELQEELRKTEMRCADCKYANSDWNEQLPKHGEWIEYGEPPMLINECSVCGQKYFRHFMQDKAKYCSMCGAKMGVQE